MGDLFLAVLNMSISAAWVLLAVLLLRLIFKKAPKRITVLLWCIVGLRLVMPFSVESIFSLIPSSETVSMWGGYSPSGFDCSGFVSYCLVHSGVRNTGRLTAQGLYNICTPVSQSEAQPGDLIFFTGTYDAGEPVTHIGIYVGNGQMIHCGHPVQYTSINSPYWQSHFYGFGRW